MAINYDYYSNRPEFLALPESQRTFVVEHQDPPLYHRKNLEKYEKTIKGNLSKMGENMTRRQNERLGNLGLPPKKSKSKCLLM